MSLSPQWLDELRARTSLSGLVRRTVKLQRAGNEWKACCPFHEEKTPSFYVNDAKGFYHCFGCGAHGDAIRWLTDQRGLAFMDAVKELAAEAGLELPAPDPRHAERAEQRAGLHEVLQAAQDFFRANLHSPEGAEARAYLAARGLDAHTCERFGFGWAPDRRGTLKEALGRFGEALLVEAGLLVVPDAEGNGRGARETYDRFRGRVTLPIHDARGRVIAFGGRILAAAGDAPKGAPKYLNSPDTPLFDKGRTLYNLHRAGPAARKSGRILVVEGYMDVIALAAAGIEEAVAPMGTALTEQQLELLWRQVDKPVLCFDGDAAGQRAAMRAIERALPQLQPGKSLEFVRLPAGLDPDDLLRQRGKAAFEAFVSQAHSLEDFVWTSELAARPAGSPTEIADLQARLEVYWRAASDGTLSQELKHRLRARIWALKSASRQEFDRRASKRKPAFRTSEGQSAAVVPDLQRIALGANQDKFTQAVLAGLARHPDQIARHSEALPQLAAADPRLGEAVDLLLERAQALEETNSFPIWRAGLLTRPSGNTRFAFLAEGADPDDAREELAEAITLLVERPALDSAIALATARFAEDPEAAFVEQQRLRKRKLEIDSRLGHLARKKAASAGAENNLAAGAYSSSGDSNMD